MKLITYRSIILLAIIVLLQACNGNSKDPGKLSEHELLQFINKKKNGMTQTRDVNGIVVKLTYQPGSMLVAQELAGEQWKDSVLLRKIEEKYDENYYFILKFSKNGKEAIRQLGDFSRYSDMVQVFSFGMNRFVNLTTAEKDTIALSDFYFDQNYGMGDGNNILLSFEKEKIKNSREIEINIAECGLRTGSLKFKFRKELFDKVPKLDYSRLAD
jgi:hypothetical protein